jgi:hypothetical protein
MVDRLYEQAGCAAIGWVGCIPVVHNDDPDVVDMRHQYYHGDRSAAMEKCATFDDFVRYCTAASTEIILKMINTVDAGEVPPRADLLSKQIQHSQQKCVQLLKSVRENQDL